MTNTSTPGRRQPDDRRPGQPGRPGRPGASLATAALLGLAALTWRQTAADASGMPLMPGLAQAGHRMAMSPRPAGFAGLWVVIRAAMMLPGLVPVTLAEVAGRAGPARQAASRIALAGGYLAVWTAAGIIPFAALTALTRASQPGSWPVYAGGAILALAGACQFSGAKRRLLAAGDPRRPPRPRRAGPAGAARPGLTHGLRFLRSSGALTAVPLVTEIMNLG